MAGEKTADGAVLIAVQRHQGTAQGGEHIGARGNGRGVPLNGENGHLAEGSLFWRHQPETQIAAIADDDGAVARRGESDFDMPQAAPGEARGARERFGARASGAEGFALHADRRDRCLDTGMAQGLADGPGGSGFLFEALPGAFHRLIPARGIDAAARRALGQGGRRHGAPEIERLFPVAFNAVMPGHAPVIGLDQHRQGVVPDFARFRVAPEMQPRKCPLQIVHRQGAVRRNLDQHPAD